MDIIYKQRLVGSVVLIALLAIILPLILTGKNSLFSEQKLTSNIPQEPVFKLDLPRVSGETTKGQLLVIPLKKPEKIVAQTSQSKPLPKQLPKNQTKSTGQQLVATKPQEATKLVIPPKIAQQTAVVKPSKPAKVMQPLVKKSPKQEKSPKQDKSKSGWIVQLGSFKKHTNATKLHARLQKKGLESFVESLKGKNGMIYRVRVGPEIKQSLAKVLKAKIFKQLKLQGIVMRYP